MLAHAILASAEQVWPPFVLVAGLLLIGAVAAEDGLFEALGARLARTSLGPRSLLLALLALVAVVTALLNLDTSVSHCRTPRFPSSRSVSPSPPAVAFGHGSIHAPSRSCSR
jgi:hypothetical protein